MELEVQLALPRRELLASFSLSAQVIEEVDRGSHLDSGDFGVGLSDRPESFELESVRTRYGFERYRVRTHLLHHRWCGATAAVAVTEEEQALVRHLQVLVGGNTLDDLAASRRQNIFPWAQLRIIALGALAVVVVDWGHVGKHLGAVNAGPVERAVRKHGDVVPADLVL